MRRPSKRRLLIRSTFALLILALTLCGRFLYGIHAENAAMQGVLLPAHPLPAAGATVLVIAPHCDDETLGAGGLIAAATRRGARVTVAFVTNGDGFRMAVSRAYGRLRPRPEDYRRMARHRQDEAREALAHLGVPRERILFLGYPDGGIAELWNRHWLPDHPYRSGFTGCSASPYINSFHPGALYCGRDLMLDLEELLRRLHPQWLYVPHPGDDHRDHWATYCFAVAALEELRDEARLGDRVPGIGYRVETLATRDPEPATRLPVWTGTQVFTYLVHRGDWPVPQGLRRDARLVPPAPLARLDTRWSTLALPASVESAKEAALLCYRSQTAVMKRFLLSFVRRDELFGALPPEELAGSAGGAAEWKTAIADTTQDTLIKGLEGAGDLTAVQARLASDRLRLRLETRLPLSPRLSYTVRLHPLGLGAERAEPLTLPFRRLECQEPCVVGECSGTGLELSVPIALIGRPPAVMIGADSSFGRVAIDRVCWRLLRLPPVLPSDRRTR